MNNIYRDMSAQDNTATIVLCSSHAHMAGSDVDIIGPSDDCCELCLAQAENDLLIDDLYYTPVSSQEPF